MLLIIILNPLSLTDIYSQNVVDNEVISNNNGNNDNDNVEETSNNEFVDRPLVHVSIQGTEINDKLRGGNGDDTLTGEDGSDTLQGQEGDDTIDGGDGEDIIDGGEGDDEIDGGDENDEIDGGAGEDEIDGGKDEDDIRGGEGDDEIDGGDGNDKVDGGDGEDKLKGGKGADRFICDNSDKIIDYNSLENDVIVGQCKYEDKGLLPKKVPTNGPFFSRTSIPDENNNFKSFISKNSMFPDKESASEKLLSKFNHMDVPNILG
ncbi:MAG TPA: calcium-binding protein [Nitrososphaeraceae archaeon]|nr:calcium-binding protein [Nitrososphaeraceae archaeon]